MKFAQRTLLFLAAFSLMAPSCGEEGDDDGDGVGNLSDNCRDNNNPNQEDSDQDDVGDVCDNCPGNANEDQKDSDADGTGDVCETGNPNDKFPALTAEYNSMLVSYVDPCKLSPDWLKPAPSAFKVTADGNGAFQIQPLDANPDLFTMTGTINGQGNFSASGSGRIADTDNVAASITGKFDTTQGNAFDAVLFRGNNGTFPAGTVDDQGVSCSAEGMPRPLEETIKGTRR